MIFNSISYIYLFLPLALLFYYLTPMKLRNISMLILSVLFIAWGNPSSLILIFFSFIVNYLFTMIMDARKENEAARKSVMIFLTVFNVLILMSYKYLGFIVSNVNFILGTHLYTEKLSIPLGLSFYTFQVLSYVFDVYRRNIKAERKPGNLLLYLIMFPQLGSGPIMRYGEIKPQLSDRLIKFQDMGSGMERFIVGLFKKVIIADSLGTLWNTIKTQDISHVSMLSAWTGIAAFTLYIYFDFSGYMDMAIGTAELFGFKLKENFNFPYISKSVSEFWRRWHMTLGSWFRDYIYIPMGGSRSGNLILNTMTVWFVTGLWHGASWTFIVWGVYFGILILSEKYFTGSFLESAPGIVSGTYTMLAVMIGWVIFASPDLAYAGKYLGAMIGKTGIFWDNAGVYYIYTHIILFILGVIMSGPSIFRKFISLREYLNPLRRTVLLGGLFAMLLLATAYLLNQGFSPSMYIGF